MKRFLVWLMIGAAGVTGRAQEKETAAMPSEVTLTSGRVLRGVQVIRWESNRVVLKHSAGADPIAFSLFKSPTPAELPAMQQAYRDAAKQAEGQKQVAAAAKAAETVTYAGQAFITTRGAGSYKLGGMTINICKPEAKAALESRMWRTTLAAPLLRVKTDADGRFSFTLPKEQAFLILAQFQRLIGGKTGTEYYEWQLPSEQIKDPAGLQLNGFNSSDKITMIEWEG